MMPIKSPPLAATALSIAAFFFTGCSGPQEDVRVTLCKRLANNLLANPLSIEWTDVDNVFREPEYAVSNLRFDTRYGDDDSRPMQAACFYDYDIVEQNARTHADPFSAYASQPYRMDLNGETVSKPMLAQAMHSVLREQGRKIVDKVETEIGNAGRILKDGIDKGLAR